MYIADSYNHSIRRYDPATGELHNLAGDGKRGEVDGSLAKAEFNEPGAIVRLGDKLYIADTNNHAIRVIDWLAKTPGEKTVSTLDIAMNEAQPSAVLSENLPNVQKLPAAQVAPGVPVSVTLQLAPDWHINPEAPSTLSLFADPARKNPIALFGKDELKTRHITSRAAAGGNVLSSPGNLLLLRG